jgi:replicative DNA helicase
MDKLLYNGQVSEVQSKTGLEIRAISEVAKESIDYMERRKSGKIKPLKTRWPKLNKVLLGGIEPNMAITIAGISGSGKSSVLNTMLLDLVELNPEQDVCVLYLSLEMLSYRNIARNISNILGVETYKLYSAYNKASDELIDKAKEQAEKLSKLNIYYVESAPNVDEISTLVKEFRKALPYETWLVVALDHTALVRGKLTKSERSTIVDLQREMIGLRKLFSTSIIQLSQMNRNIESTDRINNLRLHYPMRSDLYESDSVWQASDFVLIIHRPDQLGIAEYGTNRLPTEGKIFMHILKARDGDGGVIIQYDNELKYSNIKESL